MLALVLLILAFVCFIAAAFSVTHPRINIMSLGLALMTLAFIVERWPL